MSRKIIIIFMFSYMLVFMNILFAQNKVENVGEFEKLFDIGAPAIPGKVVYDNKNQTYRLSGSGANIWFQHDSFSMLSKKISGDFIIQTSLKLIGQGHEPHRKAGIMIRSSLDTNSTMVSATIHGDGLIALQFRKSFNANVEEIKSELSNADVIQLEKKGNRFIMSFASFGEIYSTLEIDSIKLESELYTGLYICSHNNNFVEEVEFSNVRVYNTAPDDLVQYRDYLGSLLEIMNVETGNRKVLGSSEGSWQAPNWTPNGKTLIYNSEGLLYNFDIASEKSSVLNTDFADNNNNDHVLTFDGTQIGISHHSVEDNNTSIIYTLPVTGGVPKRITEKGPSYLHGWSPDSKYLIYTAERSGQYDIYRIPVDGGKEEQMTNQKELDDGSEYSPDGKYIYFNSARTGTMQIWRMDSDGKNQIQLTFDELNDWFPHVSPDNKLLVFVSYPKEVSAGSHPFYERVYIRIMPVDGGAPKVIAYLYGGQGTMNVPSWSPDCKSIAFISNGIFN